MYLSFEFFNKALLSRQLQNVTVNSYIPKINSYPNSFICNSFGDTFLNLYNGDNVDRYTYGDSYYNQFISQQPISIDEYSAALTQFKQIVDSYGLNISFRNTEDLYAEYVSTMKFLPMSGMVSIISSSYETVKLDFNRLNITIPTVFGIKLSMPDYIKMLTIFVPTLALTVGIAHKLYMCYSDERNFPANSEIGLNGLVVFNNLNDLCNLMDQIIMTFFKRDLGIVEITAMITNGVSTTEYINYSKYMLQNFGLSESVSKQALLLGRGARDEQFRKIKRSLGIEHVDPSRPILIESQTSNILVVDKSTFQGSTGILSAL